MAYPSQSCTPLRPSGSKVHSPLIMHSPGRSRLDELAAACKGRVSQHTPLSAPALRRALIAQRATDTSAHGTLVLCDRQSPPLTEETEPKHELECANALALHRLGVLQPSQVEHARTRLRPVRTRGRPRANFRRAHSKGQCAAIFVVPLYMWRVAKGRGTG